MGSQDGRYRGEQDLVAQIQALERRISILERVPQLPSAGVNTGEVQFKSGVLRIQNQNASTAGYFGPIVYGPVTSGAGWLFYRANGQLVFSLEGTTPADQFFAFRDELGNIILADDAFTGQGLSKPYLEGSFNSWAAAIPDSTTLGTFQGLLKSIWRKQHPRFMAWVQVYVTATTAEIQFVIRSGPDSGKVILGPITVGNGNIYTYYGPVHIPGDFASDFDLDLEARVASGAGSVAVRMLSATGVGS